MTRRWQWLAALALATAVPAQADEAPSVTLGPIEARLFYYESIRLSDDLLAREEPFFGWNTPIGGGMADEAADDLFIFATVSANGEVFSDLPVTITATDGEGSLLGTRRFGSVLTGESGKAHLPLYLRDVGCAGEIRIRATMGAQLRTAKITLHCGE
jgi:hypothetical protein